MTPTITSSGDAMVLAQVVVMVGLVLTVGMALDTVREILDR